MYVEGNFLLGASFPKSDEWQICLGNGDIEGEVTVNYDGQIQLYNYNTSSISSTSAPHVNGTVVSYSLLVGPSDKQCIVVEDDLAGYLKGFQLSFLYNKPENNEDAWASNLFLTIRASSNRGCYQWGGFDYEVKIIYIYIYIYILYIL